MRAGAIAWLAERALLAGIAIGFAGCVLAPVDLTGRPCPCAQGWVCAEGVCVPEGSAGTDAGPRDASADGPIAPDGGRDAEQPGDDAGVLDGDVLDGDVLDGGTDPATRCDDLHTGALFCDGFEWDYPSELESRWGWEFLEGGTLDTVTSPAPFAGERSLRATTTGMGGRAAVGVTLPAEQAIRDGDIWLRGFFHLPSELPVQSLDLLYVGSEDGTAGVSLQAHGGGLAAAWIGTTGRWEGTGVAIPRDRWTCLQLHVVVAQVGGEVEVYVDDMRLGRFTDVDTLPIAADGYRVVEAGIQFASETQMPATLYVDEVVLSRTRVPCE